ncbi:hypothetical protein G6O69_35845 [Pseudenhygromyxa sp. WMMC2535]|uniref:hypothetical protein n=1 Tax=Pseudenhygromyxa sp. WMMC2535 TaxID=2712867 RepID=UPI001551E4C7|nr:hypothetical protein [Pseudenhygromyxa sp. WMMC2535]NVB43253.1 hypothetical protein [Pseudenhygromyxa sp. WMMC2535]
MPLSNPYTITLVVGSDDSLTWKSPTGETLSTSDECPVDFSGGEVNSTSYDGVKIQFVTAEWAECGPGATGTGDRDYAMPSTGSAATYCFCVHYLVEEGGSWVCNPSWFDPKIKIKNIDPNTGGPTGYASGSSCNCSSS